MRLRSVLTFLLVLLNTATPAPAQATWAMAGTTVRLQDGRLEVLSPNGVAPGTRLAVTLPSGTRRFHIDQTRCGLSVLPLDIAPVHRSKVVRAKRPEWKRRGLRLLFLPPYCPHRNRIAPLWRMVKYRWLAPEAYADFTTLCRSILDILDQVGAKYAITFA